jgi:hypothetical protein
MVRRIAAGRRVLIGGGAQTESVVFPDVGPVRGEPASRPRRASDGRDSSRDDHDDMSANPNLHSTPSEFSGEQVFFAMAVAFWVLVAAIVLGFFLPLVVGITMIFAVLAVVLVLVGIFLARLLSDG